MIKSYVDASVWVLFGQKYASAELMHSLLLERSIVQGYPGVPNESTWSKNTINLPDKVVGFEIFKIAQETKKLASRVPKWASPRGTL